MMLYHALLPALALLTLGGAQTLDGLWPLGGLLLRGAMLMLAVLSAVHHAEVVAHRTGEPLGTLILALAVTVIEPQGIVELNTVFKARGYRKEMGVKSAVAVLFGQCFVKSKKAATSNWANPRLSESQLVYAANDAYAAYGVWAAVAS